MKQKAKNFTVLFLCLFLLPSAYAGSSVWKISNGDKHLYLGGTIHVLGASDYPLPDEFERAFNAADKLVLETNIGEFQNPEFQNTLLRMVSYPNGQTLQQKLSAETYRALKEYSDNRGMPVENLLGFKPGMVLTTLTMLELQRLGIAAMGVDQHYYQRGIANGKSIAQLEAVEEQLRFIAEMGIGQEDVFIAYMLRDLQDLPGLFKLMKDAWRSGNRAVFDKEILEPWEEEFSGIYDLLLAKRNKTWLPKIEAMLKTKDVELVLVGVLHLAGQDGLLRMLADKGYRIEQL